MFDRRIAGLLRRGLALALGCLALSGSPAPSWAACTKVQPGWLWNYEGHLAGQHRIRMTLVFGAGEVTGVYFYASQLKDIVLRGRMLDATRLELEELDPAGRPAARFEVEFPEQAPESKFGTSPLQCEVIRGFWRKVGADTSLPVLLEMEGGTSGSVNSRYAAIGVRDPETVHRPAQAFWRAVKSDDRKTAARLIRYPIRVSTAAGPRRYTSSEQLLADYELIFTPRFRELIAQGLPRHMFVRDQGAMLGHGQVWFGADGKVIALHNPDPGATAAPPVPAPQAASDDPPPLAALRKGMPPDVSDFIRRAVVCNHWAGEEPYDDERRAQINAAVQSLGCRALDADQAALLARHARNPQVQVRIRQSRVTPL